MFEQYQGPIKLLFKYKEVTEPEREEIRTRQVPYCHVLMTQLISVALRGILTDNVQATIIKLCAFLNAIS